MSSRLPFEIREAMIKVCGKAFWYKDPLKSLLLQAGVPVPLYRERPSGPRSRDSASANSGLSMVEMFSKPGTGYEFEHPRDVFIRKVVSRLALPQRRWGSGCVQIASIESLSREVDGYHR